MSKPRIMVVEDEFVVAKDIQKTLEKLGYEVPVIETTAKAAIEKAEEIKPDLVLMDIVLKGKMDGIEAAEQIRSRFGIPVVFLTSYVDDKKLARAKKTEPFGYLIKPFKEKELKSNVEIALFKAVMEKKLRESEERYRTLIESTEDAVYLIDREMRFLYANRRYLTRHGLSLKDIEGLEYAKCHSTQRTKEFSQKVEQVFESNKSVVYEHESEKDKKIFLRTLSPVRDPRTGEINSIIVISKDITERKQAEEKLLRQHATIRARNRIVLEALTCETEEDLARVCLAAALELTGSKIGFLGKLNEAGLFDTIALNNLAWEACLIPKSKAPVLLKNMKVRGIWGRVIKDGKTVFTNDPPSHPDSVGLPEGHPPLTSFLGVPLKEGGKTFGMIALANKESGFNSADQKAMESLSIALAEVLQRKKAEEVLREYKKAVESSKEMIASVDRNYVYLFVNEAFLSYHKLNWAQVVGRKIEDVLGKEVFETTIKKPLDRCLQGEIVQYEMSRQYPEIGERILEVSYHPLIGKDKKIEGAVALISDITERKRAEEALKESENKYRELYNEAPVGYHEIDREGRLTRVNKTEAELLGYALEEMIGRYVWEFMALDQRELSRKSIKTKIEQKKTGEGFERKYICKNGKEIDVYITDRLILDKSGNLIGIRSTLENITARKQTEEALLKERNFVSAVLDTAPAIVVVLNAQGRIVRFNLAAEHLTGYKFSEVEGKYYWDLFLPPEEAGKAKDAFFYLEAGKFPYKSEEYWLTKDSERRLIAWSNSFILDDQGWVEYYISTGIDITERKKVEQKLLKSQKELRSLSKYLQDVREGERKRISREIHDELGQTLTALKIDLAMLAESIPEKQKKLLDQTKSISELIDIILNTVKKISSDLRPGLLDDFGLVPAIEWQAAEFTKRTGTKCLLSLPDEEIKIDQEHSTAIFRILQEAMTNVTRHARATEVRISVSKTDREIRLTVKDNGIGIKEKDISSSSSLGLIGIRERAQFFKGKVNIRSERDKGTTLKVSIPYPKEGSR